MKRWLFALTISFLLTSFLFGQSDSTKYEDIAKFCILRNTLTQQSLGVPITRLFTKSAIEQTEQLIEDKSYKYEIDSIGTYRDTEIISIMDFTNLQLHGLYYDVIALRSEYEGKITSYQSIDSRELKSFINSLLSDDASREEQRQIIELHATLFAYFKSRYKGITEILSKDEVRQLSEQIETNPFLEDIYYDKSLRLHKIFKFTPYSKDIYHHNVVDYINLTYKIADGNLSVEETLVKRSMIPHDRSKTATSDKK
ncbi:MAG: hypothetical protein ACRBF0_04565 [Calditrichia bacterium]